MAPPFPVGPVRPGAIGCPWDPASDPSEIIQNEKQEPLMREIQNFLDSIEDKSKQIVKANEAVNVTKIAEAALLSSQKGTPIYLDLK